MSSVDPCLSDIEGRFHLDQLTPGVARLPVETGTVAFADVTAQAFELKLGAAKDLGGIDWHLSNPR